jgi:hypothetical protein
VLLVIFLEPISRHQLPHYHRLAWLLRRGDYCLWPKEDERKDVFWAWLRSRLGQPRLGLGGAGVLEGGVEKARQPGRNTMDVCEL